MNLSLLDPFQNDFPEVIEEYLEHGNTKCIAFNRRGTLLAAGCMDGACIIWDFDTRGIAKELRDKGCSAAITSVSWSKCGHRLLASATDKSLALWDVAKGIKIASMTLQQTALHALLDPGSANPSLCLACPMSSAPVLVDFTSCSSYPLPVSASRGSDFPQHARSKSNNGHAAYSPSAASFNKRGDLVYVGNSKGDVLIIDTATRQIRAVVQIPGGAWIRQIVFSRTGQYLLTNSNDRTIRVYENLLPRDRASETLADIAGAKKDDFTMEDLKEWGSQCLQLSKEFQDAVNRVHWKAACFSGDGECVAGASAIKGEHKIHIWNRKFGQLARILEGLKEGLTDLAWHPSRAIVASVSMSGVIYLWAKDYTENWSAFAPDFKELEENEEYVEREDEFDTMPETEKVRPAARVDEDEEVDIMTADKVAAFSDSDDSQDGLYFLPTTPLPDTFEQQNPSMHSSEGLPMPENSSPPESERSRGAVENDRAKFSQPNHSNYATVEERSVEGRGKRKRKPSEKAEKGHTSTHIPPGRHKNEPRMAMPSSMIYEDSLTD